MDSCNITTGCFHTPLPCALCEHKTCPKGNACSWFECSLQANGTCINISKNCDDGNPCTQDICQLVSGSNTSVCAHILNSCSQADPCHPQACNTTTGHCDIDTISCDDNNVCTMDACLNQNGSAVCQHIFQQCHSPDPCYPAICNITNGLCQINRVVCDDGNLCTLDQCINNNGTAQCQFLLQNCSADSCHLSSCNSTTGNCQSTSIAPCDDGNNCTTNSCDSELGCIFTPIICSNNNSCMRGNCDQLLGCVFTSLSCDDNNACTIDSCDVISGCNHTNIPIPRGDLCLSYYCDRRLGVQNLTTQCPSACSKPCDPKYGCVGCPGGTLLFS